MNTERCRCACHDPLRGVKHPYPCCRKCPHCGWRIRLGMVPHHEATCPLRPEKRKEGE